jgi:protein-L-isoaspartate O-methyltransferase
VIRDNELRQRVIHLCDALVADPDHDLDNVGWWRQAFEAVPRHLFAPDVAWVLPDGAGEAFRVDREADPGVWLDAVYSDASMVTQADDGATDPASGQGLFTSSLSAPGTVAVTLMKLGLRDHDRVLEIGTGSGWSGALTCWRVGDANVTSVEIDANIAQMAKANLTDAGYGPALLLADGAAGAPDRAPFDVVHSTCAVTSIPAAWIIQTRPGGRIVTPWTTGYGSGLLAAFTVTADGTAVGSFAGFANYMMMRSQRLAVGTSISFIHHEDEANHSTTRLDPRTLANDSYGADLAIGVLAPGVHFWLETLDDGSATLWLRETHLGAHAGGSWAYVDYVPGDNDYSVTHYGPRDLWYEVSTAYLRWIGWGRPGVGRFGLLSSAVDGNTQLWLDTPDRIITPEG